MQAFLTEFAHAIDRHRLLPQGSTAVVAVSAGRDSMVLFTCLAELRFRHAWHLVAAHFHHQLRGAEADADQELVRQTAERWGCPFIVGSADVAGEAAKGESIEMAGRRLRHAFLAATAVRHGMAPVVTGHHADDQAELFLMRLLRGASGMGLRGMSVRDPSPAHAGIRIVRPLLEFSRARIEQAAHEMRIAWREDASNRDPAFLRNRIRHELMPLLAARFQPAVRRVLLREQTLLGDQARMVEEWARHWLDEIPERRTAFEALPTPLQRDILRLQLAQAELSPEFDLIEHLRSHAETPIQVDSQRSVRREVSGGLQIAQAVPPSAPFDRAELTLELGEEPGHASFGGVQIDWRIEEHIGEAWIPTTPDLGSSVERFDADRIGRSLVLRHWRPGDRFRPIGLAGSAKLQDLFTNARIPTVQRRSLILAEVPGGEICWVEGLRIGEWARLTPATRRRLRWQWARHPS